MKAGGMAYIVDMSDETWRRHANPWSVWTRFAAIPALILAVWSRVWFGWWALVPVLAVIVWLWLNPRVFAPVAVPRSWAAKGIYGERLWLRHPSLVPPSFRTVLRGLMVPGLAGAVLLFWGLVQLEVWPTLFGASLVVLAQLWRIDRLGLLYEHLKSSPDDSGQ
jgi:hypothetical protein